MTVRIFYRPARERSSNHEGFFKNALLFVSGWITLKCAFVWLPAIAKETAPSQTREKRVATAHPNGAGGQVNLEQGQ